MAHYRSHGASSNSPGLPALQSSSNPGILTMSNIHNLHEDDQHAFEAYAMSSPRRTIRQSPKLLTLDDYNLISLGYKPVLSRSLPWISIIGIAVTGCNVLSGVIPLYGYALTNGGPAWATWSYLAIGCMSFIVSLCLAELASAYPTTAAVHHWVYQLGSSKRRAYLSWMVGWFSIVSSVTVAASIAFFFASVLGQLLFSVHRVSLTPAILVMFHLGAILFWQIINLFPVRGIGYISTVTVALIIVMLSLAGVDASIAHVPFTALLNYSGSSSAIYAALSSTLMASFVFCPQDTIIRMSEESRHPERTMPWMITGSTVASLLAGLPLVLTLNFTVIKPIKGLLDEAVPGVKIIVETLGDHAAVTYISMVLVAISFTGFVRLVAATRVVYSFARDGGVPHSSYWNHLHPRRKTPQRVSWLVAAACMCCIFPFFWGNAEAFKWISSLACITANLCYVFPLWMRLTREGKLHFIPGAFSLGPLSKLLHVISIIWLISLSLVLMLPSSFPLTKNNFNYAPVALVVLTILFAISWFKARTDFTGGAKDVSRASHRMPARPMTEPPPRKLQPIYRSNMAAIEPRTLNMPMVQQPPISRQLANQSVTRSLNLSAETQANNNKRIPVPQRQLHTDTLKNAIGEARDRRHQASNVTMTSQTSIQSHPSSILGIPFSDSPETMHRELTVKNPDPTPPSPPPSHEPPQPISSPSSSAKSGLLLTQSYIVPGTVIPEISIAPPTTTSSTSQDSRSQAGSKRQESLAKGKSTVGTTAKVDSPPTVPANPASTPLTSRPMNAIDSIFKKGVGFGNKISASVQSKYTSTNNHIYGVPLRSSKDRVPTPYPFTIESATDDVSSLEDIHPYPEPPLPTTFTSGYYHGSSLSPPPRPLLKTTSRTLGSSSKSDYEYTSSLDEAVESTSIFQFPTLDGYPLVHSPSMILTPTESLTAPTMLALSRAPTVQQSDHDGEYDPSIRMPDEEEEDNDDMDNEEDEDILEAILYEDNDAHIEVIATVTNPSEENHALIEIGEEDASYEEEYNHQYPVISISPAHLKALLPSASSVGLFQLPNRDISLKGHGARAPVLHKDMRQKEEEEDARDDRLDPIERIMLQELDPEQQHLERTRSVASWAQEQARIQHRRIKKRARAQALKALRQGSLDGVAGKMIRKKSVGEVSSTTTPSSFSGSLSSWSSSQSSSGGRVKGKGGPRHQMQPVQTRALGSVKEGVPMQFIDGEEDDDEDYEHAEDGAYPKGEGQGVQSKGEIRRSIDIESVGAGVGSL
ncbi:hypothetical protein BG003_006122 [Podila horticola]|nr:hypothetical protein BG003_006122 [Podila horticola]